MKRPVFINEHLEGAYESVRATRRHAETQLENAVLREALIDLIEAGGNAMHALLVSGGEPKWRHDAERESVMALNEALHAALSLVMAEAAQ